MSPAMHERYVRLAYIFTLFLKIRLVVRPSFSPRSGEKTDVADISCASNTLPHDYCRYPCGVPHMGENRRPVHKGTKVSYRDAAVDPFLTGRYPLLSVGVPCLWFYSMG